MKVTPDYKMVIVVNENLPAGLQANTAAVLSLTIGHDVEGLLGPDLKDGSGDVHKSLTTIPLPILKSSEENIVAIRNKAKALSDVLLIDITDAAQTTKNYNDYEVKLSSKKSSELKFLGLALAGSKKDIQSLSGNLGLLR